MRGGGWNGAILLVPDWAFFRMVERSEVAPPVQAVPVDPKKFWRGAAACAVLASVWERAGAIVGLSCPWGALDEAGVPLLQMPSGARVKIGVDPAVLRTCEWADGTTCPPALMHLSLRIREYGPSLLVTTDGQTLVYLRANV